MMRNRSLYKRGTILSVHTSFLRHNLWLSLPTKTNRYVVIKVLCKRLSIHFHGKSEDRREGGREKGGRKKVGREKGEGGGRV